MHILLLKLINYMAAFYIVSYIWITFHKDYHSIHCFHCPIYNKVTDATHQNNQNKIVCLEVGLNLANFYLSNFFALEKGLQVQSRSEQWVDRKQKRKEKQSRPFSHPKWTRSHNEARGLEIVCTEIVFINFIIHRKK